MTNRNDIPAIRAAYSEDDGWNLGRERVLALCDEIEELRTLLELSERRGQRIHELWQEAAAHNERRYTEMRTERDMWRRNFWEANRDQYIDPPTPSEADR